LTNSTVTTSGNTTSDDSSSFYGLNAGVLANSSSTINLSNCRVSTTGTGANGVFATGSGTSIILSNDTITCTKDGGHGVDATFGGVLTLTDVIISTAGAHGAAISTDRGGGTVTITGGTATASGQDSPGIYCTGTIAVSDATVSGTGAEGAVIEGANSITLTNTALSGVKGTRDRGVMIYQSMSGDAQGTQGIFTMTGGSFTWPSTTGPVFYVTNSTGVITLNNVTINNSSGTLVKAAADQWGTSGSNGGTVIFTANGETMTGDMIADSYSSITATLKNSSTLTGAINSANTAKAVALTLDISSTWTVTATSYLSTLIDSAGISGTSLTNIIGNGYNVYYNASVTANSYLNGKTYSLVSGGNLAPTGSTGVESQRATLPTTWVLDQNYPNPFNPTTTIAFALPEAGWVTLTIDDALGREVATLIDDQLAAGYHYCNWNAGAMPSGMYVYRIVATSFTGDTRQVFRQTKKLLLMK
jgi:hypothetical protein